MSHKNILEIDFTFFFLMWLLENLPSYTWLMFYFFWTVLPTSFENWRKNHDLGNMGGWEPPPCPSPQGAPPGTVLPTVLLEIFPAGPQSRYQHRCNTQGN